MNTIEYLDFDLSIEKDETGYRARVINSPTGQANTEFTLPFNDLEIENFILRVGRTRRGVRRVDSPELHAARKFGQSLFDAVFDEEVKSQLRTSLNEAQNRDMGLRIRLRLSEAPELMNLPWEYLYDSALDQFLVLTIETPLVRYLEIPREIPPLAVTPPLNILVMVSSPSDYPALDVEREWKKLHAGLQELIQRGAVTLERLEKPTLSRLQRQLRKNEYHIFHFIGHGGFDDTSQDSVLIMEDEAGRGHAVSGGFLGTLMQDEKTLRLVVLNACEGARTSIQDPFAGAAQTLVQRGLPAVIAMQFEISDEASITLATEFYDALADGYPVDAALAEARKAILGLGNDIEWGTPVLYMQAPDGRIFDLIQKPETEAPPPAAAQAEAISPQAALETSPEQISTRAPAPPLSSTVKKPKKKIPWVVIAGLVAGGLICVSSLLLGSRLLDRISGASSPTPLGDTGVADALNNLASLAAPTVVASTSVTPAGFAPPALTPTPTPPVAVNLTNNREGGYAQVSLGFDSQRQLHLVYSSRLPRGGDYYHQQWLPDGGFSPAESLTAGFDYLWSDLVQAIDPEGYLCMLWGGVSDFDGEAYYMRCQDGPDGSFSPAEIWKPKSFDTRTGFSPLFQPDGSVKAVFARVGELTFEDQVISAEASNIANPHLVQDPTGTYHLVWFRTGDPYSLEYNRSEDAGVSWSPAERLTTEGNAPERWFDLAADRQGNLHLVWPAFDNQGVFYRRWSPAEGWSEPVKIASAGCGVRIAVNTEGLARVAQGCWNGVFFIEQLPDGDWLPAYKVAEEGSAIELDIVVDDKDRAYLAWLAQNDIFFTSLSAQSSP